MRLTHIVLLSMDKIVHKTKLYTLMNYFNGQNSAQRVDVQMYTPCRLAIKNEIIISKKHIFIYPNPDPNPSYIFSFIVVRIHNPKLYFW